jgi:lipoprotein-anchoring transpeptidase ErfK/SrfK
MAVARTRSAGKRFFVAAMTVLVAGVAIWWWRSAAPGAEADLEAPPRPAAARPAPAAVPAAPLVAAPLPPSAPIATPAPVLALIEAAATAPAPSTSTAATAALPEASAALAAGNAVQARRLLNQAVDPTSDSPATEQMVQQLSKLADDMLFSPKIMQNDPLVIKHVVESGQNLQKIANLYKTTVPLICRINNISNPNNLRQGQPLKIVLGPFHAVVSKHNFRMAVYCQDTLVKVFPVGLGAEDKTPTGRWIISLKQLRPRYYPPNGGKILEPDDPTNPLGGYWMALEGIEGEAVGQERYGIHGTIEPDTIGKNASLGCIRLLNEDVALVYEMLVVRDSIVTVKD